MLMVLLAIAALAGFALLGMAVVLLAFAVGNDDPD